MENIGQKSHRRKFIGSYDQAFSCKRRKRAEKKFSQIAMAWLFESQKLQRLQNALNKSQIAQVETVPRENGARDFIAVRQ